ncbi:hypothetical protein GCM10010169_23450 [Micromonospora fulviviridis]|uniref:hypothetical protein n=1 Tax=Micromonospora fulviviridis TaxID=47860 RepID=UPI00166C8094|nr:hypothetical protein [Micromonospora fulviviridis]GGR78578.1 hypothetical protein GCM10010169_23450 [Micromonospora fulviviridis]
MDFRIGARVGPFMVSAPIGKGSQPTLLPITLDQFVAQAQAAGFSVQVTPGTSATIERRWQAATAWVVPGRGVAVKRAWSTWSVLTLVAAVILVVVACCGPAFYNAAQT